MGTKVIELLAIDKDSGPYGTVDYTIINKLAGEKFSINQWPDHHTAETRPGKFHRKGHCH